jgi:hypothetical protein
LKKVILIFHTPFQLWQFTQRIDSKCLEVYNNSLRVICEITEKEIEMAKEIFHAELMEYVEPVALLR